MPPRHAVEIYLLKENLMEPTVRYKVMDVSPDEPTWTAHMEEVIKSTGTRGMGTRERVSTAARSPTSGLHDRACPKPGQYGAGIQKARLTRGIPNAAAYAIIPVLRRYSALPGVPRLMSTP